MARPGRWVRRARDLDVDALVRLLIRATGVDERTARQAAKALLATGRLFVLQTETPELGGAAHVTFQGDVGSLDYLVVDPGLAGLGIGGRLVGFAHAYCEVRGCARLDVVAHPIGAAS